MDKDADQQCGLGMAKLLVNANEDNSMCNPLRTKQWKPGMETTMQVLTGVMPQSCCRCLQTMGRMT